MSQPWDELGKARVHGEFVLIISSCSTSPLRLTVG